MQSFLDWFRSTFPYYRGACDNAACGASGTPPASTTTTTTAPNMQSQSTFLGLSCANHTEATTGKAAVVEYWACPMCGVVTRSPRYNAALAILHSRRGRCGEYNLLLLRMLQALGHSCRWVYDKDNGHIWSEVQWDEDRDRGVGGGGSGSATTRTEAICRCLENSGTDDEDNSTSHLGGRRRQWLHLDPCEAAVNQNLLCEQQWGRYMATVFAFCAPPFCGALPVNDDDSGDDDDDQVGRRHKVGSESPILTMIPTIEDVTDHYRRSKQSSWWLFTSRWRRPTAIDAASVALRDKIVALQAAKKSRESCNAVTDTAARQQQQHHHHAEIVPDPVSSSG
jgi:rubredoxin